MMELLQRGDLIQASLTKFSSSYTTTDPGCECYDLAGEHFNPSEVLRCGLEPLCLLSCCQLQLACNLFLNFFDDCS